MKLSELAAKTGADFQPADGDLEITGAAAIGEAKSGEVTFLSNPRYTPQVALTQASAIYVAANVDVGRADLTVL